MIARIAAAAVRSVLMVLLIAMPSLILAQGVNETPEGVVFLALLAGALVFAEYNARAPSFVEFRNAPPLNRIKFGALLLMLCGLALMLRHDRDVSGLTTLFHGLGMVFGHWLDFPLSPVQLMTLILPSDADPASLDLLRAAAGFACFVALAATGLVALAIRVAGWPVASGSFNVWTNLPLFDPTTGGDVVHRMTRDGRLNVILGVLLPFAIPGLIKAIGHFLELSSLGHEMMLTWGIALWAFVPASMVMRGIAMLRVADLIAAQRRRTYAASDQLQII
ncbi:hypothetical protein GFB49_18205 [Epibacterium sp. SM1979]|uniref:Uncharacterized protein n=1 Tax=Tritonibacter litoralis TaxID=2662264 RepID=A0A843YL67_9RHOB|nr:hypothetical protein [Tritonibacter litoralis]